MDWSQLDRETAKAEEMAGWPAANFENPETQRATVLWLTAPTLLLAVAFTGARFYSKRILRQPLWADDWIMLVAATQICSIPVSVMAMASLNYGLGRHVWDQKLEWGPPYSKMAFAVDFFFPLTCSLTKISLCLTYLRLFPSRANKIFCYLLSTFVTLYTGTCIFLMLFQCTPIRGYWDHSVKHDCINLRVTLISIAALNSFSDFLVFLWPTRELWSLQLPLKQRVGLIVIFAVGSIVCVAGICRMYYLKVYFDSNDLLWHAAVIYAVVTIEMNLGIICGCLSGVKPVVGTLFPRLFPNTYKSSNRSGRHPLTYDGRTRRSTLPAEAFAFQPLTDDASNHHNDNNSQSRNGSGDAEKKLDHAVSLETMDPERAGKEQRNFAWGSASGGCVDPGVPRNAIAVDQVVEVRGDDFERGVGRGVGMGMAKDRGDGGSEEWIMEELRGPAKR
ncbi:hypothetical protein BDV95DRAFT_598677 [Massariosphaeria phaeospora]|uniref:Rhodopsin domain-containing protein n=1 Tax=Massariosphaeria phaeospora TaxID=100035 RepID=A0A7C8HZY7_9PLEO|nr:hypothetical protein BDV95DRAFT_598677 [Massariosphaeria phaeospora]